MECKIIILLSLIIIFSSCSEREKAQESTLIKKPQVQNFNYRKDSILVRNNYQKITNEQLPIDSVIKHLTEFTFSKILINLDENNYITDTILANIGVNIFEKQISRFPHNLALRELKGIFGIKTKQPLITKNELIDIIAKTYSKMGWEINSLTKKKPEPDEILEKINRLNIQLFSFNPVFFKEVSDSLLKKDKNNITNLIARSTYFKHQNKYQEALASLELAEKRTEVEYNNNKDQIVIYQKDEINFHRILIYKEMNDSKNAKKYYNKLSDGYYKAQIQIE